MADYTKLTVSQWRELAARFGLEARDCSPLKGGRANTSYRLSSPEGEFVLTICDEKGQAEAERMAALLEYLHRSGIPVSQVFRTIDGALGTSHERRPVLLKSFVPGSVAPLDNDQLAELGDILGRLHILEAPRSLASNFAYGLYSFSRIVERPGSGDFGVWLKTKQETLAHLEAGDLPRGLIHGDLFWDNVVSQGQHLTLLDFEEACHYLLGFDLGMTIVGTCFLKDRPWLERAEALLKGYQSRRRLDPKERSCLRDFAVYAATATASWRYWHYRVELQTDDNSHLEMVEVADAISLSRL